MFVIAMYVDLDTILNNLSADQKIQLNWFYKSPKDFFIDDFSHILDLYPTTTGPLGWDIKRSSNIREEELASTKK